MSKIKIELTERELKLILDSMTGVWVDSEEFQKLWFRLKAAAGEEKARKELILWAEENGYFWEGLENV